MSNQNNTMQKLEMQSNVNLSRYKNNIDGALKVNDTNMPVLGNKFNPMKKDRSYITVDKMFNGGGYNYDIGDKTKYYYVSEHGYRNEDKMVALNVFYNTVNKYYYYYDNFTQKILRLLGSEETGELCVFNLENGNTIISNGVVIIYLDEDMNEHFLADGKLYDVIKIKCSSWNTTNHTRENALFYKNGNSFYLKDFTSRNAIEIEKPLICGEGITSSSVVTPLDTKSVIVDNAKVVLFNESTNRFELSNNDWHFVDAIKEGLSTYTFFDYNFQENGFLYCSSCKVGTSSGFKVIQGNPLFCSSSLNTFATLENNIPVDNLVFIEEYDNAVNVIQGCNIVSLFGVPMGIINQKYMEKIPNSYKLSNSFYDREGYWKTVTIGSDYASESVKPCLVGNNIYYGTCVANIDANRLYRYVDRRCSINVTKKFFYDLKNNGLVTKVFVSNDDWTSNAKYWTIGNGRITDENFILPQLAPILTTGVEKSYYDFCYVQKGTDDATLYNYLNEPYVAPTDGDFYIPLMPTDTVISDMLGEVVIRRIDGSTAKLTRYNNKILSCYQYSNIAENIDYTFVCQGQRYNVADGVIYDENATGIVDVSDMQFIGCNGIFALFWNVRSQTIYQFNASNGLDKLIESDNIQRITFADINHVNDEIYIAYVDFNGNQSLICIENDGSIYKICNNDITDFFIGDEALFVKVNNKQEWDSYTPYRWSFETANQNCYLETNYYGTDEFKLMNVDRVYLRFVPTVENGPVNDITVNLSMLTLDSEVNEQYIVNPSTEIHRIAPRQKQCLGIKVRLDNLVNYTLSAMSIGITDDSNVVTDNKVINNNLDASLFD